MVALRIGPPDFEGKVGNKLACSPVSFWVQGIPASTNLRRNRGTPGRRKAHLGAAAMRLRATV
jgi:hypothetical protein